MESEPSPMPEGLKALAQVGDQVKMHTEALNFYYGTFQALNDITLKFPRCKITALIGPSGCGKSTFLRCLNRMNDIIPEAHLEGKIHLDDLDIYDPEIDVVEIRRRIGMVFQKPNPFPKSVYENIAYAPKIHGDAANAHELDRMVESALTQVGLWGEVKNRLHMPGTALSGGQQQRLCIARCLAIKPEVILMDEPTSALDPVATARIEELILQLKQHYTIIIVTHNMHQAMRIADYTAFFYMGDLIEFNDTQALFKNPAVQRTSDYIRGRFG